MKKGRMANLRDKDKKGPSLQASKAKESASCGESGTPGDDGFPEVMLCPECGSKMIPQGCRDGVCPFCGFSNCL
jgi:hypothetical protein